jgi:hypothetical protein
MIDRYELYNKKILSIEEKSEVLVKNMLACKEVPLVIFDVTTFIQNVCLKRLLSKHCNLKFFCFAVSQHLKKLVLEKKSIANWPSEDVVFSMLKTEFFQIIGDHKRCTTKIFI